MESTPLKIKHLLYLGVTLLFSSCVAYYPPSSMHHDMKPTQHPVYEGQDVQELSVGASTIRSVYHHRSQPEVESSNAKSFDLHYGIARKDYSAAIGGGYSFGNMIGSGKLKMPHQNLILRSSASIDQTHGKVRLQLLKFQIAASTGYGVYQDSLVSVANVRDRYNYIYNKGDWLWSTGFGTQANVLFSDTHSADFGFFLNHSTDFRKDGFREDFFSMQLGYTYQRRYTAKFGTMFDARLLPRGETVFMSVGYHLPF